MEQKAHLYSLLKQVGEGIEATADFREQAMTLVNFSMLKEWQGQFVITEKGKGFIFQWQCEQFLRRLQSGQESTCIASVGQWVLKHQFAIRPGAGERWKITNRGRDWLSQLI